jgi:hypothetical protein
MGFNTSSYKDSKVNWQSYIDTYFGGTSIYNDTKIDFIIPSPSNQQILDLSKLSHIQSVTPFIISKANFSMNSISIDSKILIFENEASLDNTMYNDSRSIVKLNYQIENGIILDYSSAKILGANIGDEIKVSFVEKDFLYTVFEIFEDNTLYKDATLVIFMTDDLKNAIEEKTRTEIKYSGAFITSNNYQTTKAFLFNYIPLGLLRDPSEFANTESYELHFNAVTKANYSNEISDFNAKRSGRNFFLEEYRNFISITSAVFFIVFLSFNLILSFVLKEGKFIKKLIENNLKIFYYYLLDYITIIFTLIVWLLIVLNFIDFNFYISSSIINSYSYSLFASASILTAISYLISYKLIKL